MNQSDELPAKSQWQVYGVSCIGKSHIDTNLPNQDSIYFQHTESGIVAVVCDGAGSAQYSQAGAQFFSQAIGQMLINLSNELGNELGNEKTANLTQTKSIIAEQIAQIRASLESQLMPDVSLRDYHTTFTGVWINDVNQALLVQIGDSPLLSSQFVVTDNQIDYFANLQLYGDDSKNEYINETHFITQDNWQDFLTIATIDLSQVDCIALMSDGCADLVFEGASVTPQIYRPFFGNLLFNLTQSQNLQQGSTLIEQALANPATYRLTGDDKSLIVLIKNQQHYQAFDPIVEVDSNNQSKPSVQSTVWHTPAPPSQHLDSTATQTAHTTPNQTINHTNSTVLPPSQSISAATKQRRNTAVIAGAALLLGTGVLGWVNKERLFPAHNIAVNSAPASAVASTTVNTIAKPQLIAQSFDAPYTLDIDNQAWRKDSNAALNELSLSVVIASPQGQTITPMTSSSTKTDKANKVSLANPRLTTTVTTLPTGVTGNTQPPASAATVTTQNKQASTPQNSTPFINHLIKVAVTTQCQPITDMTSLASLGITTKAHTDYQQCQVTLPLKAMITQLPQLSMVASNKETINSLTFDKGLSEILTLPHASQHHTAAIASQPQAVSNSSDNPQIQLYYLGLTPSALSIQPAVDASNNSALTSSTAANSPKR